MLKKGGECLDDNAHAGSELGFVLHAECCHRCKLQTTEENHSVITFVQSCFLASDGEREGAREEERPTLATPFGGYSPFNLGSIHCLTVSSVKRGVACVHRE
jgi:hypothetical protein